ncbi:MAG TPA: hypothetical protein V6D17_01185 [Candidatus Obscuribacterales bacterium]
MSGKKHQEVQTQPARGEQTTESVTEQLRKCAAIDEPSAKFTCNQRTANQEYAYITSTRPETLLAREREMRAEVQKLTPQQMRAFNELSKGHESIKNPADKLTVERLELALVKGDTAAINSIVMAYAEHRDKAKNVMDLFGKDLLRTHKGKGPNELSIDTDWDQSEGILTLASRYFTNETFPRERLNLLEFHSTILGGGPVARTIEWQIDWNPRNRASDAAVGPRVGESYQTPTSLAQSSQELAQLAIGSRPERK